MRVSPISTITFLQPSNFDRLLFSPTNTRAGMERITRKCLTYSHVHASYLRGPPDPPPGGPWEELRELLTALCRGPVASVTLEPAGGPEGARISRANSMRASRVERAVCVLLMRIIGRRCAHIRGFRHHTTNPPSLGRLSTAQTNWFLLAAAQCHWLLWEASLSTATHSSWSRAYPPDAVSAPCWCCCCTPDRTMPRCRQ